MATKAADLYAEVSTRGVETSQKEIRGVGEGIKKLEGGFRDFMGGLNFAVPAIGFAGLGQAVRASIDAAIEAEKVSAQLSAVIRSTGMAAGLTAAQVANLSGDLANMAGVDDELVTSASTVMLTFTKIGKDAFPRAVEAAMNLSNVFGSLESSTLQVGKALNDPISGLTALNRAGVQFSDEQERMIKRMVEAGDIAGAQNIIFAELDRQVGNVARAAGETAAGSFGRLQTAVGNLSEAIGGYLLPTLSKAADAAALILTWNDNVNKALGENKKSVLDTAESWDDYLVKLFEAERRAGTLNDLGQRLILNNGDMAKALGAVSKEQFILNSHVLKASISYEDYLEKQEQIAIKAGASAQGMADFKASIIALRMSGHAEDIAKADQMWLDYLVAIEAVNGATYNAARGIKEIADSINNAGGNFAKFREAAGEAGSKLGQLRAEAERFANLVNRPTRGMADFRDAAGEAGKESDDLKRVLNELNAELEQTKWRAFVGGLVSAQAEIDRLREKTGLAAKGMGAFKRLAGEGFDLKEETEKGVSAYERFEKKVKEAEDALKEQAAAATEAKLRNLDLAESMKGISAGNLGKKMMDDLAESMRKAGVPSQQIALAMQDIGLGLKIMTPESIKLAEVYEVVNGALAAGVIPADKAFEATQNLARATRDGKFDVDAYARALGLTASEAAELKKRVDDAAMAAENARRKFNVTSTKRRHGGAVGDGEGEYSEETMSGFIVTAKTEAQTQFDQMVAAAATTSAQMELKLTTPPAGSWDIVGTNIGTAFFEALKLKYTEITDYTNAAVGSMSTAFTGFDWATTGDYVGAGLATGIRGSIDKAKEAARELVNAVNRVLAGINPPSFGTPPPRNPPPPGSDMPFAAGGARNLPAGRPVVVGERGSEIVIPSGRSDVIPNHRLGGTTYNFTINAPGIEHIAGEIVRAIRRKEALA